MSKSRSTTLHAFWVATPRHQKSGVAAPLHKWSSLCKGVAGVSDTTNTPAKPDNKLHSYMMYLLENKWGPKVASVLLRKPSLHRITSHGISMEHILVSQIMKHFEDQNILSESQFGFTPANLYYRVSTKNRKVLHFVVSKDFHTDLPLRWANKC